MCTALDWNRKVVDSWHCEGAHMLSPRSDAVAAQKRPGEWIKGHGWQRRLLGGQLPSKQWIDAAAPHNPVFLTSMDMHMGLANSRALEIAGVDASTPDPPDGQIFRDASGVPTGVLT